ncbi:MAG: hypothetical protein R2752_10775 [Vicinamibacterales bacterium]
MHDYLQILGVAHDAPAVVIRRANARRAARMHPDFRTGPDRPAADERFALRAGVRRPALLDVAIDFLDMTAIVDRMQASFFRAPR